MSSNYPTLNAAVKESIGPILSIYSFQGGAVQGSLLWVGRPLDPIYTNATNLDELLTALESALIRRATTNPSVTTTQ